MATERERFCAFALGTPAAITANRTAEMAKRADRPEFKASSMFAES